MRIGFLYYGVGGCYKMGVLVSVMCLMAVTVHQNPRDLGARVAEE